MSENSTLLATLLGAIVGGVIGFGSAYLVERQRFNREDEEKLFEKVYGKLYSILERARMRYEPEDIKSQWHGKYLLSPPEVMQIETIFASYFRLIPTSIHALWMEAKLGGPTIQGLSETESDNLFLPFDLEEMQKGIAKKIRNRGKQSGADKH